MAETFDPYHKWLGISPKDQPPNYYRLLGLDLFESDSDVIDAAANRQMSYLQQRSHGTHAELSQRLLTELASARICLLNPMKKAAYDAKLRAANSAGVPGVSSLDFGEILEELATSYAPTPVPAVRAKGPFQLTPLHAALGIGAAVILVVGLAIAVSWATSDREVARRNDSEQSRKNSLRSSPASQSEDAQQALNGTGGNLSGPVSSSSRPSTKTPERTADNFDAPVTHTLRISPPNASLTVREAEATVAGTGAERQIVVADPRKYPRFQVVASCAGYKTLEKSFESAPPATPYLTVALEKEEGKPGIVCLIVNPPEAAISVSGAACEQTGSGSSRTITVKNVDSLQSLVVVARCAGYKTEEQQVTAVAGETKLLTVSLEKMPAVAGDAPPPPAAGPAQPKHEGNVVARPPAAAAPNKATDANNASFEIAVDNPKGWFVFGSETPIAEVVAYDAKNRCARFLREVAVFNMQMDPYHKYKLSFQYRRPANTWAIVYLQPHCGIKLGPAAADTGNLCFAQGRSFKPSGRQRYMVNPEGFGTVSPLMLHERPVGAWNDMEVVRIDGQWTVSINRSTVNKAQCSTSVSYPFWVSGSVGFEFRDVTVRPIPEK